MNKDKLLLGLLLAFLLALSMNAWGQCHYCNRPMPLMKLKRCLYYSVKATEYKKLADSCTIEAERYRQKAEEYTQNNDASQANRCMKKAQNAIRKADKNLKRSETTKAKGDAYWVKIKKQCSKPKKLKQKKGMACKYCCISDD